MKNILSVSIGIFAYNEEKNIERLLNTIQLQKLNRVEIKEILVISSGSTDRTNNKVKKLAAKNKKIKLIAQRKRFGKASGINIFLEHAKADIVIVSSADILLPNNAIENIVTPLKDKSIGIVGSRPYPTNEPKKFFGFAAHLIWKLHHEVSLTSPKMGEFIAFRKVFKRIPVLSGVDEVNIEALVRGQGYKAYYEPKCVIYNKGAENLQDFITRRRYIYAGHLSTKREYSYEVSTINGLRILFILLKNFEFSWKFIFWTPAVIILEVYSRLLGTLDYYTKTNIHPVWQIAPSTKDLPQIEGVTE